MAKLAFALILPCLVGLLARIAGAEVILVVILTILAGIRGAMVASRTMRATKAWPQIVVILTILVAPLIVVVVLAETRPFGPIRAVPVGQATAHPLAAGFRFTDGAAPRLDLREDRTEVSTWTTRGGGPGRSQSSFAIAPVLPPDWRPGQPVTAVVVAASRHEQTRRVPDTSAWSAPGGLLRLLPDETQTRAVHRALQQRRLEPARDLVIGVWVADPGWARLDSAWPALLALGAAILVVLVLAG